MYKKVNRKRIKNKLITSRFATCACFKAIAQDALSALLENLAIIKVESKSKYYYCY
jgi:hypothetical protein